MKVWNKVIFTTICALILIIVCKAAFNNNIAVSKNTLQYSPKTYFEPGESPEGSVEEIYRDIFMVLLSQHIEQAVDDYYGQGLTVDPWSPKILSVERPNGYRTFRFIIKLEIMPYVLAHISAGIDHITLSVDGVGNIKVEKFEHIKSYELPKRSPF